MAKDEAMDSGIPTLSEETCERMTRVTLEATPLGYTVTLWAGEEKLAERSMRMMGRGRAKGTSKGDWYDVLPDREMPDALEELMSAGFEISGAMQDVTGTWPDEE